MKIDKYPCVVWHQGGWRVKATEKGPVLETLVGADWQPAALDKAGHALLAAYHALMQTTDCEVPVKAVTFPTTHTAIDMPQDGPPDDDEG